MPRLDRLSEVQRLSLLNHNVLVHEDAPWTHLRKPLEAVRLALVSTAGLHLRGDRPFTGGDQTFRQFPYKSDPKDIVLSHTSIGFDRSGLIRDLNVVLPLDRVSELVESQDVGSVGPNVYTFLGAQRTYAGLTNDSVPEVGRRLKEDGVDAVLLTGT